MCGGLIGAPLGARLTARLPERLLRLLFLGVLLVTGAQMLLNAVFSRSQTPSLFPGPSLTDPILVVLLAFLLGVLIGAWSSSMGMGGGILTIPALVLIFGVNQHTAAGTSLLVMIPNTLVGSFMHLRQQTASLRAGSIMGIGAFFGAAIGIWMALLMND
ncbi:sulfite exporter TauE/SafE family protein [Ktedonobacter racemifer]|uniref:sulfite exporter TauE/SafE family protein n=1 Tax=Ktedonobacter racemifer TaxID=363277 RepID=UPI000698B578|nr:sulfite exporter TauE/SafE family protein [Ktedonobacter racemifer]